MIKVVKSAALIAASISASTLPMQAAPLSSVKVVRIVDGRSVFVDGAQAHVNQIAGKGSVVSSKESRAELLFDRRAIGLLGKNTLIKVGARCFSIDSGLIVVNGPQSACVGSRILGVRGTTYVLARESDETYTVSVLAGESILADDVADPETDEDILAKYPKVSPWAGAQAGGFGAVYPSGGGSFIGGLNYFVPISQSGARSILYSSTSLGSSFQNLWGAGTEIGFRNFAASNQSTTSTYLGYSGYGAPGCFGSLINAGGQWEKSRWRLGASGGIKINNCPSVMSYGALNLSVPVGRVKDQPLYLSISPYVLGGNAVGTSLLNATSSNVSPGVRASVEVPINERLSIRGFTGADAVYGVTIGGFFTYRIPTSKNMYIDPNSTEVVKPLGQPAALSSPTAQPNEAFAGFVPGQQLKIALEGRGQVVSDAMSGSVINSSLTAQGQSIAEIEAGKRGRFSSNGVLIAIEAIPKEDFTQLLIANLGGQNPLPESRKIAKQAQAKGSLTTKLSGILGIDYFNNASRPVSMTVDTPFSPVTQMPVGRYVCAATPAARSIGAQNATSGQFNYSGEFAYFGRGSKTSQGYPATTSKSQAYVFSDPGVCAELNRQANQGYDVVVAEQI